MRARERESEGESESERISWKSCYITTWYYQSHDNGLWTSYYRARTWCFVTDVDDAVLPQAVAPALALTPPISYLGWACLVVATYTQFTTFLQSSRKIAPPSAVFQSSLTPRRIRRQIISSTAKYNATRYFLPDVSLFIFSYMVQYRIHLCFGQHQDKYISLLLRVLSLSALKLCWLFFSPALKLDEQYNVWFFFSSFSGMSRFRKRTVCTSKYIITLLYKVFRRGLLRPHGIHRIQDLEGCVTVVCFGRMCHPKDIQQCNTYEVHTKKLLWRWRHSINIILGTQLWQFARLAGADAKPTHLIRHMKEQQM